MKVYALTSSLLLAFLLIGCGKKTTTEDGLFKITLQTDWYAQPEHGGFYQAMAKGFYEEEGLDVTILPGGPNAMTTEKVAQGRAQFAIGRSDDVVIHTSRGVPLLIAGALMQKDPQAILFHRESGIQSFEDLDGKTVMASPGAAYIEIIERKFDIEIKITPLDYGMARFIADPAFIQQCFITNEPYYVQREGANPGTLLIADSGFSPYRVFYTTREFAEKNPDVVRAFTRASIRGWFDYLYGDPEPANAIIAQRNPQMDPDFMSYARNSMIRNQLVTGDASQGQAIGKIEPDRLATQVRQLLDIGMIESDIPVEAIFDPSLMPEEYPVPPLQNAAIPLHFQRASEDDLQLRLTPGVGLHPLVRFLRIGDFQNLPQVDFEKQLDIGDGPQKARGVPLQSLFEALALSLNPSDLLILANCSDRYQSNFDYESLQRNQPVLITHIGSQTVAEWALAQGNPGWGPYLIDVLDESGLVLPAHKKPWGVQQLVLAPTASLFSGLILPASQAASDFAFAHTGFDIYLQSCASCHNTGKSTLGGTLSNRSIPVLASQAKYNPEYFHDMLVDPVGTNPIAERMPKLEGWSPDQREELRLWLAEHAP